LEKRKVGTIPAGDGAGGTKARREDEADPSLLSGWHAGWGRRYGSGEGCGRRIDDDLEGWLE